MSAKIAHPHRLKSASAMVTTFAENLAQSLEAAGLLLHAVRVYDRTDFDFHITHHWTQRRKPPPAGAIQAAIKAAEDANYTLKYLPSIGLEPHRVEVHERPAKKAGSSKKKPAKAKES